MICNSLRILAITASFTAAGIAGPVYTYNTFVVGGAGTSSNTVTGINNAGDVTGYYHPNVSNGEILTGFILQADGTLLNISPGNTFDQVEPFGINNSDTVSGWNDFAYNANSTDEAFIQPLGSADTYYEGPSTPPWQTYGYGINDSGVEVGYYRTPATFAGFIDNAGAITVISDPANPGFYFEAYGINDSGEVVGDYVGVGGFQHGFLRATDGSYVTLDAPGAAHGTFAQAINSQGDIAGYFVDAVNKSHGFVYLASDQSYETIDLGGSTRTIVSGINDSDQISGVFRAQGAFTNTDFIGTAESATPEPASFLLLGAGLAAIAAWRRRRQLVG